MVFFIIMPRQPCYWTRKLELDLVEFIREREFVWRASGNTNHHIQLKYKAFAEFAARLGKGFTARSVRDRWVNIRSTFNHNVRRIDKSKETAATPSEVYVPTWPLWKPLQFLREAGRKDDIKYGHNSTELEYAVNPSDVKEESMSQSELDDSLLIRQRARRTDRPRRKDLGQTRLSDARTDRPRRRGLTSTKDQNMRCTKVLDDLIKAMEPLKESTENQTYKFFGKHVTARLNSMREVDAESASRDIMKLLDERERKMARGTGVKDEDGS